MVNQKKQLEEKRVRLEGIRAQAQLRVEEANKALEEVEKNLDTTREQIIAKEQELQRVLREQPTAPVKKDLGATIETFGTSVEELGTLLKAKGMEQGDAEILGGKLKECMDMLHAASGGEDAGSASTT